MITWVSICPAFGRVAQLAHVRQVGVKAHALFQLHRCDADLPRRVDVGQVRHQAKPDPRAHIGQRRGRGVVAHRDVLITKETHRRKAGDVHLHRPGLALLLGRLGGHDDLKAQRLRRAALLERLRLKLRGGGLFIAQFPNVDMLFGHALRPFPALPAA